MDAASSLALRDRRNIRNAERRPGTENIAALAQAPAGVPCGNRCRQARILASGMRQGGVMVGGPK